LKQFISSGLLLLFSTLLLVELTVSRASPQRRRSSLDAERVVDLFKANCARCHGADGKGDTPLGQTYHAPDFTDPEWWRKHSDISNTLSLISIVSHGKGGMPAFGKKLKHNEIKLLVSYVRRFRR
jgi:mono/diheme cytochrome c family protein